VSKTCETCREEISIADDTIVRLSEKAKKLKEERDGLKIRVKDLSEGVTECIGKLDHFRPLAKALEDRVKDLKKERDALKEALMFKTVVCDGMVVERNSYLHECQDYRKATAGHTMENLKAIMEGIPEAADLEHDTIGAVGSWDEDDNWNMSIICTPIVEYIEADEITNDHAKQQPPCEAGSKRYPATLLHVASEGKKKVFTVLSEKGSAAQYWQCRIKKTDLQELDK